MSKDWKYFLYVASAFGLYVVVKLLSPVPHDWTVTFSHEDKNPYGAFALSQLLPNFFSGDLKHSYKTLYELRDSLQKDGTIVIIASTFDGAKEDSDMLLSHVASGGSAFISAQSFTGHFADTLNINTYDYFFNGQDIFTRMDSSALKFTNPKQDTSAAYYYRRDNIHDYFNRFDTTRTTVIARNDRRMPVTIRIAWGKGILILNCTPLIFTNIYMLSGNHGFPAGILSYLTGNSIMWTEYYHLGRMEIGTPLRFILTSEPLRWGYYITVFALILFMTFELKRKQRMIPIILPLKNTTLEFVRTIGNLYLQQGDHKNIAEKKIHFLMESIRSNYRLSTSAFDKVFIHTLAGKTGKSEKEIEDLVSAILDTQRKNKISEKELIELIETIEKFNVVNQ